MPPTYPMPPFYPRPGALPCCPGPSSRPEPFQPNPLGDPHLAERLKRVLDTLTADMAWVRANKVAKAPGGVPGNIAGINADGNLYDTGKRAAGVYDKPDEGIPYADLSEEVRGWLDAASAAVQPAEGEKTSGNLASWGEGGVLADSGRKPADFATASQGAKADTAVQAIAVGTSTVEPGEGGVLALPVSSSATSSSGTTLATSKAVRTVNDKVTAIEDKIPSQASASNQLADKDFVNSSVATETAAFRGTYNLVTDLELPLDATHEQVAAAVKTKLGQAAYDKHDYVFVQVPQDLEHTDAMKQVDRYKCVETGTDPVVKSWEYEWTLNNSSFTAAQWAAVNSGITAGKLDGLRGKLDLAVYEYPVTYGYWTTGEGASEKRYTLVSPASSGPLYKWVGASASTDYIQYNSTSGNIYRKSGASGVTFGVQYPDLDPTSPATVFPDGIKLLGDVLTYHPTVEGSEPVPTGDTLAKKSEIPSVPVASVNGKTGEVTLTGADIAVSESDETKIDAALAGKASTADATLTERGPNHDGFSAWGTVYNGEGQQPYPLRIVKRGNQWVLQEDLSEGGAGTDWVDASIPQGNATSTEIEYEYLNTTVTATRTALSGYQLGSQTDKPLASEAEVDALRTAVADKKSLQTPVPNPTGSSSTADYFVDSITQNAEGVITATRKKPSFTDNWAPNAGTGSTGTAINQRGLLKFWQGVISREWAANTSYEAGADIVIHRAGADSKLYICTSTHTSGASWDQSKWRAVKLADLVTALFGGLEGKASTADATLTERTGLSAWSFSPASTREGHTISMEAVYDEEYDVHFYVPMANGIEIGGRLYTTEEFPAATSITWRPEEWTDDGSEPGGPLVATRTALSGYQLGTQTDKPLASEAEAEALRTEVAGKANDADVVHKTGNEEMTGPLFMVGTSVRLQSANRKTTVAFSYASITHTVSGSSSMTWGYPKSSGVFALTAGTGHNGNLAALDAQGNPTNSGIAKDDVESLLFAQYYPEGNVKSAAEFTTGIKYDAPDTVNRTIMAKPFCNTGDSGSDNSGLVGRVVIPPFVDATGNGYISDDGTRFKVVGASEGEAISANDNLTAIVAPNTMTTAGDNMFVACTALTSVSLPAAERIGHGTFYYCTSLTYVDFGNTPRSSVPTLGSDAFGGVPTSCKIIVPYTQYDAWIAAENWRDLEQEFVRHAEKAGKPATFTAGNLAEFDSEGNPVDSGKTTADFTAGAKVQRIYNSIGTDALDDKGSLRTSTVQQSYWTLEQTGAADIVYDYVGRLRGQENVGIDGMTADVYVHVWNRHNRPTSQLDRVFYNPDTGKVYSIYMDASAGYATKYSILATQETGVDPRVDGSELDDMDGVEVAGKSDVGLVFSPTAVVMSSSPYAHMALESAPTRTIAGSYAYAVGDLLGDSGKAYRCTSAYTSAATPVAPSSDTAHWTEVPTVSGLLDRIAVLEAQLAEGSPT